MKQEREGLEKQKASFFVRLREKESLLSRVEMSRAQESSERKRLEKELSDRFHLTIAETQAFSIDFQQNLNELDHQMRDLRQEMEKAGAINLASIEEYKQYEERFQLLEKQLNDLEESKKELEKIISRLDGESRKQFKKTFEETRKNFQKNFEILFEGGSADLTFTEHTDVLEAGVEIIAKPPGKQMRSITLLSGGEKCLTALALLFSLFEVKPAPFCILDEVDAPLDETNVERFTNVLRQFIDRTQFLIVTHNKKTMAAANVLFGVSMEEKGFLR